jgi:DNA-binding NarL/FixJ family response regulator
VAGAGVAVDAVGKEMAGGKPRTVVERARVLAVDDDASFLALLHEVVRGTRHLEIAGEAESGERAVAAAPGVRPDMVLMDVNMPGLGGVKAAQMLKAEHPAVVMVLISTTHPDEIPVRACADCADAVIWKSVLGPRLLDDVWLQHGIGNERDE